MPMIRVLKTYIAENKTWFKFTLQWFLVSVLIGAIVFFFKPTLLDQILELFKDKFGADPDQNLKNLAKEIFVQNTIACLIAIFGGIIFGISSFAILFFNGFIIGVVLISILLIPGNPARNLAFLFGGLVPHGIFELPAFFISSALGLRIGTEYLSRASAGRRGQVFLQNLKRVVIVLPFIVFLLAIAAVVEVFISGSIVGNF
jgi:stage II sporulation protein M